MSQNKVIYDSLGGKNKQYFLLSCHAKYKDLYGVPRLVLNKNSNFKKFFNLSSDFFKKIDSIYFPIIDEESLESFIQDNHQQIIFDIDRVYFDYEDNFLKFLPNNIKKQFNLYYRDNEKQKFIKSNLNHFKNSNSLTSQIIKDKLYEIWQSKWDQQDSYFNFDILLVDNILHQLPHP